MTTMWNPHAVVERMIADILRAEPWFKAHRVTIVEQNEGDFATLMKQSLAQIGGVVLVVGIDAITNNYPAAEVNFTVSCTEGVPINRAHQNFATALDVAQAAIQMIDGEWWHWERLEHESPAEGVFQATAYFKGAVKRVETSDPTKQDETIKGDD